MEILFENEGQITKEWLEYLELEASALAESSTELEIDSYVDRELLNPQFADYLSLKEVDDIILDVKDDDFEPIALNAMAMHKAFGNPNFGKFKKLKRKIRKIFCEVTKDINGMDWKTLIGAVLVALIPVFASGIPALLLPLIVGIVAQLMKKGYNAVCPV